MAKVLRTWNGYPSSKYPWERWLDGRVWLLEADTDFVCLPTSMSLMAHAAAKQRGLKVRTSVYENGDVKIQQIGKREP